MYCYYSYIATDIYTIMLFFNEGEYKQVSERPPEKVEVYICRINAGYGPGAQARPPDQLRPK